jgi:hypothetical protein
MLTRNELDLQDNQGRFVNRDPTNSNLCGTCGHGVGFHPRTVAVLTGMNSHEIFFLSILIKPFSMLSLSLSLLLIICCF